MTKKNDRSNKSKQIGKIRPLILRTTLSEVECNDVLTEALKIALGTIEREDSQELSGPPDIRQWRLIKNMRILKDELWVCCWRNELCINDPAYHIYSDSEDE